MLSYDMFNAIYYTTYSWKIKNNPNCQIPEIIVDTVWDFPIAQQGISNFTTVYKAINDI